jgi:hypothetical protein
MYGQICYAPERIGEQLVPGNPFSPIVTAEFIASKVEPGAEYFGTGFEIEYLGRWGNSTGFTSDDWNASNLTADVGSGSFGPGTSPQSESVYDTRQSCIDGDGCHPADDGNANTAPPQPASGTESSRGIPYGTKLLNTLGAPNYMTGDFNKDGVVDAADFVMWVKTQGQPGIESNHPAADSNHDFFVNTADYNLWAKHFGSPKSAAGGGGFVAGGEYLAVPEPASSMAVSVAVAGLFLRRRLRLPSIGPRIV